MNGLACSATQGIPFDDIAFFWIPCSIWVVPLKVFLLAQRRLWEPLFLHFGFSGIAYWATLTSGLDETRIGHIWSDVAFHKTKFSLAKVSMLRVRVGLDLGLLSICCWCLSRHTIFLSLTKWMPFVLLPTLPVPMVAAFRESQACVACMSRHILWMSLWMHRSRFFYACLFSCFVNIVSSNEQVVFIFSVTGVH